MEVKLTTMVMKAMMQPAIAVLKVWRCPSLPDRDIIGKIYHTFVIS